MQIFCQGMLNSAKCMQALARESRGPHSQSCIGNYLDVGQDTIRIIRVLLDHYQSFCDKKCLQLYFQRKPRKLTFLLNIWLIRIQSTFETGELNAINDKKLIKFHTDPTDTEEETSMTLFVFGCFVLLQLYLAVFVVKSAIIQSTLNKTSLF